MNENFDSLQKALETKDLVQIAKQIVALRKCQHRTVQRLVSETIELDDA